MSAQRLYELDRSLAQFPEHLDELFHDREWVEQLKLLPESELVELAGHLHDVWLISLPATSHSSTHRFSMISTAWAYQPESVSIYCGKFAVCG